jgi:DNA-binding FrmR family transcriptional regulator
MMRAFARVDPHAADRIDDGVDRVTGRRGLIHQTGSLETDTPEGYIAGMRLEAKTSVLKRLKRIEGQVRGLARMVEDDRYCIDIVTQLSAATAALRRAEEEILADHVAHCVEHAIASGNKAEQRRKVSELIAVLSRTDR